MSEVPLWDGPLHLRSAHCPSYRGTLLIRNSPPPQGFHRALGIVLQ